MSKLMSYVAAALAAGAVLTGASKAEASCYSCGCGTPAVAYYYYGAAVAPCVPARPVFVVNQGPVFNEVVPLAAYSGPAYVYGRPYTYVAHPYRWAAYPRFRAVGPRHVHHHRHAHMHHRHMHRHMKMHRHMNRHMKMHRAVSYRMKASQVRRAAPARVHAH